MDYIKWRFYLKKIKKEIKFLIKIISLQFHYKEFYFLPLYSLCSTFFSYSFFSKDSKSEISKGLCGAPARSRTADLLITNQ